MRPDPAANAELSLRDVYRARTRIQGRVRRTPLLRSDSLSRRTGAEVFLKLESLQETGAFKLRGATNKLMALGPDERTRGVVTVSTGNHGRAVAFAGQSLGIRATVCMSELVPRNKVAAIEALGAEVRISGRSQDEAEIVADRLAAELGMVPVSPFDDPFVIAGQGTIGLELLEDLPDLDAVLVPLSGGGLLGGVALVLKAASPAIRMVGITMERGAAMHESLKAGRPVEVEEVESLADSLGGGIGRGNRRTFDLCRRYVDDSLLVSEVEIADGMRHLFFEERLVAEGGAAVGVSALLHERVAVKGLRVAVIISGRNVDMRQFLRVVGEGSSG
jgi:threonine dehydratase